MRKILLSALWVAALAACASKGTVMADSAIAEAKALQNLAKEVDVQVPTAVNLIADAERQKAEKQNTEAFVLADEAILQLQIALLKQENKDLTDSLAQATEALIVNRKVLEERKSKGAKK